MFEEIQYVVKDNVVKEGHNPKNVYVLKEGLV